MWYSKLSVFQVTSPCPSFQSLNQALEEKKTAPCPNHQWQQLGWVSPYPETVTSDALVHAHHQYLAMQMCLSQRLLPSSIIQQTTQEEIATYISQHGEAPKAHEKKKMRESVINQLLPRAFVKKTYCPLYFDTQRKLLFINSSSSTMIEQVISLLRASLGGLALEPLNCHTPLADLMTEWLMQENPPQPLTIGQRCTIADFPEQKAQCTFKGQEIGHPHILNHLEQNRRVTELALEWPEHLRFQLKSSGIITGIKCLDGIQNQIEELELDEAEAYFRANFILMTDTLQKLMSILIKASGGLKKDPSEDKDTSLQSEDNSVMV